MYTPAVLPLLLACTAPDDDSGDIPPVDPVAAFVDPGPFRVGYRQSSVTWSDDLFADRTLRLALWYPTEATRGDEAAYLDGAIDAPDVLDDPTPAPGTHPVVLFSHGHQGFAENSSFLAEHLASHGYVVAAPDHTGNTTFDPADRATEIYLQRARDLSAVLDALPNELDVDTTAVVATGHSFGGYTVLALAGATYDPAVLDACTPDASSFCSTMTPALDAAFRASAPDPRVVAAVPMAAGDYALFGADGLGAIEVPVLQMTGELDPGDGAAFWAALQGGANRRVDILGAGHQAFTDFSGVLPDGGTIDPEEGFRIVRAYALAATRRATAAEDDAARALLDGDVVLSDAAVLSR